MRRILAPTEGDGFEADTRAQSVQIGALLIFAALIIAAAGYQASIVPDQNSEIEVDHNEQLHGEMIELRNTMVVANERQSTQDVPMTLGTEYPDRTLFVNPSSPSGTLGTDDYDGREIVFENATVNGTDSFETQRVEYRPGYNEFDEAPATVIEHGFVYNDHGDDVVPLADHELIEDGEISLFVVEGDIEMSAEEARVAIDSASAETQTVEVEKDDDADEDDDFTVELPTQASEAQWDEMVDLDADEFEYEDDTLIIDLDEARNPYDLTVTRVAVDEEIDPAAPAYLTEVEGDEDVTIELRDEFHDPIDGASVTLTAAAEIFVTDDGTEDEITRETDRQGQVGTTIDADGEDVEIDATYDGDGSVTDSFDIEQVPAGDGETGTPGAGAVSWVGGDSIEVSPDGDALTAETGDAQVTFATENESIVDVDRETAPPDGTVDAEVSIDDDQADPNDRYFVYVFDHESGDRITVTLPEFLLSAFETPTAVASGDTIDAAATVENADDEAESRTVEHYLGAETLATEEMTFDPNEETVVEFSSTIGAEPGTYEHGIAVEGAGDVTASLDVYTEDTEVVDEDEPGDISNDGDVVLDDNVTADGEIEADEGGSVTVGDDVTAEDEVEAAGDVTIGDDGEFQGEIEAEGDIDAGGEFTSEDEVEAEGSVTVSDDAQIDSEVEADGDVTFGGDATVEDDIDSEGDVTVGTDSVVGGEITAEGVVTLDDGTTVEDEVEAASLDCGENVTIEGEPCSDYEMD